MSVTIMLDKRRQLESYNLVARQTSGKLNEKEIYPASDTKISASSFKNSKNRETSGTKTQSQTASKAIRNEVEPAKPHSISSANDKHNENSGKLVQNKSLEESEFSTSVDPAWPKAQQKKSLEQNLHFIVIGGLAFLAFLIGVMVWIWFIKRKKNCKNDSFWEATTDSSWKYNPNASDFDKLSENPISSEAGLLKNGMIQTLNHQGSRYLHPNRHESKLWGTSRSNDESEFFQDSKTHEKEGNFHDFYSNLDFGPLVMATYGQATQPRSVISSCSKSPSHDQEERLSRVEKSATDIPEGPYLVNYQASSPTPIPITAYLGRDFKDKNQYKSTHKRNDENYPNEKLISSPSLDYLKGDAFSSPHDMKYHTRQKKDTIVGLADSYGNQGFWDGSKIEHMHLDKYIFNPDTVNRGRLFDQQNNQSSSSPYYRVESSLAVPPPALTSVNQLPFSLESQLHAPVQKNKMSAVEASDELKNVLNKIEYKNFDLFRSPVHQSPDRGDHPHTTEFSTKPWKAPLPHNTGYSSFDSQPPALYLSEGIIYQPPDNTGRLSRNSTLNNKEILESKTSQESFLPFIKPSPAITFPELKTAAALSPSSFTFTNMQQNFHSPSSGRRDSSVLDPLFNQSNPVSGTENLTHYGLKSIPKPLIAPKGLLSGTDVIFKGSKGLKESEISLKQDYALPNSNDFIPLEQMNLEANQPNYRSATLSVYDMYQRASVNPNILQNR
ncbi:expressed protein [Phakopsora pachyrhizi]|uniref:Expressed protein n=1 Tax=Phakopsora pachyrhizi TaxID=170000 RepID=A0AAV0BV46_PHAPC|nr:expressed protein [Phakopsora pachyrhizi]